MVHHLISLGHIRGDGFSLVVNYWDQNKGSNPHKLCFKVYTSLIDLPLVCWSREAVSEIIFNFGVLLCISRSSLNWEDFSSFDFAFLRKDLDTLPKSIEVTVSLCI